MTELPSPDKGLVKTQPGGDNNGKPGNQCRDIDSERFTEAILQYNQKLNPGRNQFAWYHVPGTHSLFSQIQIMFQVFKYIDHRTTYGPEAPGWGKPSILVFFSLSKGKASAGWEMKVSKFGQVLCFPNWTGDLNYWRHFFKISIFIDFFVKICSLDWKTRQLKHWKSPFTWKLWIFCCTLWKRAIH